MARAFMPQRALGFSARTVIQHSMGWSRRPPGRPRETGRKTANHRTGFTRSQSARQVWADIQREDKTFALPSDLKEALK